MTKERKKLEILLMKQIMLIANWNKKNINNQPEQVRKNVEVMTNAILVIR